MYACCCDRSRSKIFPTQRRRNDENGTNRHDPSNKTTRYRSHNTEHPQYHRNPRIILTRQTDSSKSNRLTNKRTQQPWRTSFVKDPSSWLRWPRTWAFATSTQMYVLSRAVFYVNVCAMYTACLMELPAGCLFRRVSCNERSTEKCPQCKYVAIGVLTCSPSYTFSF